MASAWFGQTRAYSSPFNESNRDQYAELDARAIRRIGMTCNARPHRVTKTLPAVPSAVC